MSDKWEYSNVEDVARVIFTTNSGGHPDVESVVRFIKRTAERELPDDPGYVGTGGWYVTSYLVGGDGEHKYHCSLMAYSIEKFLQSKGLMQ